MSLSSAYKRFIERLPKAETHIHLEGSIRAETIFDLAAKNDVGLPVDSVEELVDSYEYEGLEDFIDNFGFIVGTMQTSEDFERVTAELGADAARQNVRYREVAFGYSGYVAMGLDWETVVEGIVAGSERAREEHGVELRFVPSVDRTTDPAEGVELVERADEMRDKIDIAAIGLAGKENGHPAHRHERAYDLAGELGFDRVAHAGEDAGPGSVWDALNALDVSRIDHGVRAAEDEILLDYLEKTGVPLATCPVSNVALNVYEDLSAHPVADLLDRGLHVTINSDDPPMFHADLNENYVRVADTFDLAPGDVVTLAKHSFESAFLEEDRVADYCRTVERRADELKTELDLE